MIRTSRFVPILAVLSLVGVHRAFAAPGPASALALPPASQTIPTPLTVDQAVQIGLQRNAQITAGIAGIGAAAATYKSLAAIPPVNLTVTHVAGSSAAPTLNGTTTDTFIDLGDTVDTSGQRRFQAAGAKAQLGVTQYTFLETKLTLTQQIRDAYWSLVAAHAQAEFAHEGLAEVQRVNALTQLQLTAGSSPRVDVVRSSIDVANAQQSDVSARGAETAAQAALNVLLFRAPAATIQLADNFTAATTMPAAARVLPNLQDLTRLALQNRPAARAAQEQVRAAEYVLKQAQAARYPDVSVDVERSVQVPVQTVLLGIRLPLLDFGSVRSSITAARQSLKQAQEMQKQTQQQIEQQVAQAYTDYTLAQQLTSSYQTDILTPSVTLVDMAQLGYKQGATGILPVIDAETTLRNARTGFINSILAYYKAQDEMDAATGAPAAAVPGVNIAMAR